MSGSSLRNAIKKVVVAVAGPGNPGRASAEVGTGALPPPLPLPSWRDEVESTGRLVTPHGPVRAVAPRAELYPRSGRYPHIVPGPAVPAGKRAVPMDELEYYPRWHVGEHPRSWTWPSYLNPDGGGGCRWMSVLKELYASPFSFPSSLAPESGLLVHSIVRNHRPKLVIETGSFIGVSTLWIAAALAENGDGGVVHAFDDFGPIEPGPWREVAMPTGRLEFVANNIAKAGLADHVVFHPGNSSFEIRAAHEDLRASGGGGGCQLAFLDADHGVVGVWQDFWATEPLLATGGLVLLHDTFPGYCGYDGPRHLLDHVNQQSAGAYEKLDLYLAPMNYGLGLIRRVG
jgi:predicted O-methyltransferase YrrM